MWDVLEVHLMELPPVFNHLVELSVAVSIPLHFLDVCRHLYFVLFQLLLHELKVFGIYLVLLHHIIHFLLIVLVHAVIALYLTQPRNQLQIIYLEV